MLKIFEIRIEKFKHTVLTVPDTVISFIFTWATLETFFEAWAMIRAVNIVSRAFGHTVHVPITFIITFLLQKMS